MDIQTCDKYFKTNIKHFEPFLCLANIIKTKNCIWSNLEFSIGNLIFPKTH